jgi:hypothetical protein
MNRTLSVVLSLVVVTAVAASAAGPESKYRPPRTKDGHPDLGGVWNFASDVPLLRPAKFADKKVLTKEEFNAQRSALRNVLGLVVKFAPIENVGLDWIDSKVYVDDLRSSLITYPENGRLPELVEGVRRNPGLDEILASFGEGGTNGPPPSAFASFLAAFTGGSKNSHTDFSRAARCLESIPVPILPQFGNDNYLQIVQGHDHMALVMDFGRRIIALDAKAPTKVRTSMGTSSGRWEGDTLVVETRNFTARTPGFAGAGNSRDKVVTERFTRTSAGLEYTVAVVDPSTFKDRIELSFPMAPSDAHIYEATCHEGNYSLANTLSASRKQDEAEKTQ